MPKDDVEHTSRARDDVQATSHAVLQTVEITAATGPAWPVRKLLSESRMNVRNPWSLIALLVAVFAPTATALPAEKRPTDAQRAEERRSDDRRGDEDRADEERSAEHREEERRVAERSDARAQKDPCLELKPRGSEVVDALRAIRITQSGTERPIMDVRIHGLRSVDETQLWRMIGPKPPPPISSEHAAVLLARLSATELFAQVTPTLRIDGDPKGAVLELEVVEVPTVSEIEITGLTELRADELLEVLLEEAHGVRDDGAGDDDEDGDDDDDAGPWLKCPPPVPPRDMLARMEAGRVAPGFVWKGLPRALGRMLAHIVDEGYVLASAEADLSPQGQLKIRIDEGRLDSIQVRGAPQEVEAEIHQMLQVNVGRVFLLDDLDDAVDKVLSRYPYLNTSRAERRDRRAPRITEERGPHGGVRYRIFQESSDRARKTGYAGLRVEKDGVKWKWNNMPKDGDLRIEDLFRSRDHELPRYLSIEGNRATVHFEAHRTDVAFDFLELLRHTPVTGFAPGVTLSGSLYDGDNRVHVVADGAFNLNTSRPEHPIDFLVGPKLRLPGAGVAELGGQIYAITDSADRWRIDRIDSYVHSFFLSRPYRDYHRREGFSAFATGHFGDRFTAGAEYRRDTYESMESVNPYSVWNGTQPWVNRAVDEGRMGSIVGRIEYSTRRRSLYDAGGIYRTPETSLFVDELDDGLVPGFRSMNTVEVANPELGGEFRFVKIVSDNTFHFRTRSDHGLRLRVRGAGGNNLPAQKVEALGGWGSLRGYDYKEFAGDVSVLMMAEYHLGFFSVFADGGSVRQTTEWTSPRIGVGAAVNLGSAFQVAAAWRTDDRARLMPEIKAVINRTF
jgi:hypothetical protein